MNVIDIIIILFFITALVRGVELGVVRQLFSTAGLLAGVFAGSFIQGKLIHLAHTPATKTMLALTVIIIAIGLFSAGFEYAGMMVRQRIERAKRAKVLDKADKALGSVVAGATLLAVVWLVSSIFTNMPVQSIQKQIRGSVIIAQLNKSLPPAPNVVAKLGHLIDPNGFPNVFTGLEPSVDTTAPLPSIGDLDPAVQTARASVVKIQGDGCGGISNGSGFVAADNLVITNAHVVAGVGSPSVIDGNGRHKATVIGFDPGLDIAVLRTAGLAGKPLAMLSGLVGNGTPSAALGYPGGGDFAARPSTILESFNARGRNIYNQGETLRQVYSIKSSIEPGNSGGPLIDKDGNVIGIIFAESTAYEDVGYALTTSKVIDAFNTAKQQNNTVGTGSCTQ
ncbi:MAG TPA: MarP family serine protease [Candidatus Saccharimonadales bacterium]|nr:MarP family serine protease [Candidatus Saccharimonadales bacterium]